MVHASAAASSNAIGSGSGTQGHEQHSKARDPTYSESLQCHIYCDMTGRMLACDCKDNFPMPLAATLTVR